MQRPIKAGVIGCGSLALKGVLPQLAEADARARVEVVALCDVVEARACEAAAKWETPQVYTDAGALIDEAGVDLVIITTPIPYHYQNAMRALRADKHVYVQKTMAMTYAARACPTPWRSRGMHTVAEGATGI